MRTDSTNGHDSAARIREQYRDLTVIIPFLNEGKEVELTVKNIRETASYNLEIILINDSSTDGYDYESVAKQYGCRYVQHDERRGVAASRDEGAGLCQTPFFLLLDAHMELYRQGWNLDVSRALDENPESIICLQTKVLRETRDNVINDRKTTFGAFLSLSLENIFKCKWNTVDHSPKDSIIEIPVILGGAYACSREYWQRLHGLRGLINYGLDEELISLKAWMEGGRCLLMKDIQAGHIYRKKAPYEIKRDFVLGNKIFIIELFFDNEEIKKTLYERLKRHYGEDFFLQCYNSRNRQLIEEERDYFWYMSCKDLLYFLLKNETLR
jgi:glycosyltransferase involved in cell wall biosynthesis